ELGTRNQELEQPPRYGSHLNRRPESRIKSIGWPPSIEQSPSTLRDTLVFQRIAPDSVIGGQSWLATICILDGRPF
ncbi:MAG: hypothetical protein V2A73_03125, partial [Pseudomonadota bacterium]